MQHIYNDAHRRGDPTASTRPSGYDKCAATASVSKTGLFNALREAREDIGIGRGALAMLWALINTTPDVCPAPDREGRHIVFASNARLMQWLNLSSDSSISRSLRQLEELRLVSRHMSGNGKRFARRKPDGSIAVAFGIDIMPFMNRAAEIEERAALARARKSKCQELRARISMRLRELRTRGTPHLLEDAASRLLRRKSAPEDLESMLNDLEVTVTDDACAAKKTQGLDMQNGQHIEDSTEDRLRNNSTQSINYERVFPTITRWVEMYCTKTGTSGIPTALATIAVELGISKSSWDKAVNALGLHSAMIAIGYIAERRQSIRHPRAYLHSLATSLRHGQFSHQDLALATLRKKQSHELKDKEPFNHVHCAQTVATRVARCQLIKL